MATTPDPLDTRTPTAAYSMRLRVLLDNVPGTLGRLTTTIGEAGGNIRALEGFEVKGPVLDDEVVVDCIDEAHQKEVLAAITGLDGVELVEWEDRTFALHDGGKIEVLSLGKVGDRDDLSMAYTPGVARVCMAIKADPARVHDLTIKRNTVAIVTDGTAVLGLGDIGPEAALPVMEGKALLFKEFAGVDGFPICLDVHTPDEIVETVVRIAPVFGGINLEDIAAPVCFDVEERLRDLLDIPVFHDDQHGTAVVTLAALENALKIVDKEMKDLSVVIAGAGAAGVAIAKILKNAGVQNIIGADRKGAIHNGRDDLNEAKRRLAEDTNPEQRTGTLAEIMPGTDVFVGVSGPGIITPADVESMAADPIVFAMANPDPEIRPEAIQDLAAVIATGRSDFPNQINNVLAFPGIFRGALDAQATTVTEGMKVAAADAIARAVSSDDLRPDHVVPSVFDKTVVQLVAAAVATEADKEGCHAVIRVVTFDFWNTLLATKKELHERRQREWIEMLAVAGHEISDEQIRAAVGHSWQAFVEDWTANRQHLTRRNVALVLEHLEVEVDPVVEERLIDAHESDVAPGELEPAPNLAEALAALKATGVRIGIICDVAMTSGRTLRRNLDTFGVLEYFDHFSFSDEVGVYKPSPDIFAHALEGLGGSPEEAAHVGDLRRTDVAGANGAGWTSVRYTGLFDEPAPADEGPEDEADHVIADHAELAGVLGLG